MRQIETLSEKLPAAVSFFGRKTTEPVYDRRSHWMEKTKGAGD